LDKEAELLMDKFLKQARKSLGNLSKSEADDRIATIKAHVMDAVEDQKGKLSDIEIVEKTIKDFGIPKERRTLKDYLIGYLVIVLSGVFLIFLDVFLVSPNFGYSASIPYFVVVLSGVGGYDLWNYFLKDKLTDKRYNLIFGWIFLPVLVLELWLLDITIGIPSIGDFSISWIVLLIYGIILIVFTVLSILVPGEMLEKECPSCKEIVPYNSRFCLKCGEELE